MAKDARRRATSRTGWFVGLMVILAMGSAPSSSPSVALCGKITLVDPTAGRIRVAPLGTPGERLLRVDRQTLVEGGADRNGIDRLAPGQYVKVALGGENDVARKVTVVLSPGTPDDSNPSAQGGIRRSTRKPTNSTPAPGRSRAEANRVYELSVTRTRSIDAVLTYELTTPKMLASEWVVVAPLAPELPGQMNVRSHLNPGGEQTWDLTAGHRPLLLSRLAVAPGDRSNRVSVHVTYQATLLARHLNGRRPGSEVQNAIPLGTDERRKALAQGGSYELDAPEFRRWLSAEGLAWRSDESEVDFARRVFLAIRGGLRYEYREGMDRRLSQVCATRRSDCGGLALLFAAVLRSQTIPARILVGRWALSAEPGARLGGIDYDQWHVKAEFYAEGVGWIPADPAASLIYDHSPEGLQYFGHDPGDFLTWHVDPDLVIDSIHFGPQPAPLLNGGLAVWVVGSGSVANPRVRQDWQVHDVEAPPSRTRADRLAGRAR